MSNATRWLRPEPFRNPWRAVAVALLPLMILGLLISALWNPQDRLDTVKAAIVNLDEPVKVNGQTVPLGRQLAAGLVSGGETADAKAGEATAVPASDASYDWQITDEAGAADGLADGTYAAVVTIPKGFSAAATSFGGDDPAKARQATIDVATPANGRVLDDALAQIVAQTATGVLGSTLTETYVDNVLVGFSTLSEELGKAADGAGQLADGANEAGKGAEKLADGAHQTSAGVAGVGDGVNSLAGGVGQWATGANQWAVGADQVSAGAAGLAPGPPVSRTVPTRSRTVWGRALAGADSTGQRCGASSLAVQPSSPTAPLAWLTDPAQVAAGAKDAADGAKVLAGHAADASEGAVALVTETAKVCADPLRAIQVAELCATLAKYADLPVDAGTVEHGLAAMSDRGARRACTALPPEPPRRRGASNQVAAGVRWPRQWCNEAVDRQPGACRRPRPARVRLAHKLASGATELAGGSSQLASGASGLAGGARELSGGAGGIASGANGARQTVSVSWRPAPPSSRRASTAWPTASASWPAERRSCPNGLGQATEEIPSLHGAASASRSPPWWPTRSPPTARSPTSTPARRARCSRSWRSGSARSR